MCPCPGQSRWCVPEHLCALGPPERLACNGRRVSGVELCETEKAAESGSASNFRRPETLLRSMDEGSWNAMSSTLRVDWFEKHRCL